MDLKRFNFSVRLTLVAVMVMVAAFAAQALNPDYYSSSSLLSSGKWARVITEGNGMRLISTATLRKLGFEDPSRVRVYGFGGRMLPEILSESIPDDLPPVPSVVTPKGVVFFAVDLNTWTVGARDSRRPYGHEVNPYTGLSCYIIGEGGPAFEMSRAELPSSASGTVSTFTERIVHERDLYNPGLSGRTFLGEDFRANKSQTFSFTLPDNASGDAVAHVRFGTHTSNGTSFIVVSANGKQLPAGTSDEIKPCGKDQFMNMTSSVKEIEGCGDKLDIKIDFSYSGALFHAGLDYIEVFYERSLSLRDGQLYFFDSYSGSEEVRVKGCSASTQIWDVTDRFAPALVNCSLNGTEAAFVAPKGYHEYVAFNPESVAVEVEAGRSEAGRSIANQDLHSLPVPDMVIITLPDFREGSEKIAQLHRDVDGMTVHVLLANDIYNEFSGGRADFSAFRRIMKMWHDREGGERLKYCLLMGKPTFDPRHQMQETLECGYSPMLIWQSPDGDSEINSFSNDDYIGMLEDVESGRFVIGNAKINVAVGRLPVKTSAEALAMASKIEKYVKNPNYGAWRNKVMIIADDGDNGNHLAQAEAVYDNLRSSGNGKSFLYDRLYLDSYPLEYSSVGAIYPKATERMLRNYNDGVLLTNYIGHGSTTGWGHEHLWDWHDIIGMTNRNLTFIYAATCRFNCWDSQEVSAGERLMLNPDAGIIGMMVASRSVYIDQNGKLNGYTSSRFFVRDEDGLPLRFGDVYREGKNMYATNTNKLRYCFMGDPALRIPSPSYSVDIESINGIALKSAEELPEVKALGKMKLEGVVRTSKGDVDTEFDGTVNLQVYDAERVITTYGNGDDGVQKMYNDRKTRLAAVSVRAEGGRWKASVNMPPEIENNYSPARIVAYAWDGHGKEANGETEKFYVYGIEPEVETDTVGPEVEYFYLNNERFETGSVVNSNSLVIARVSDASGINISDAGIGHKMSLTLDGARTFADVDSYFESDPETPGAGVIAYPLSDVAPGSHSLELTVWDNANNSSKAKIDFQVAAASDPVIYDIYTDCNPASESVVFTIEVDRPNTLLGTSVGVYDLNGKKVWGYDSTVSTDASSRISKQWDLRDSSGIRVPRGIYIYRASVETPEGTYSSKSKKLAVTAQ